MLGYDYLVAAACFAGCFAIAAGVAVAGYWIAQAIRDVFGDDDE